MLHPEFQALRRELQALYRHPDSTRQVLELATHVAMMLGGGAAFFCCDSPWLRLAGVIVSVAEANTEYAGFLLAALFAVIGIAAWLLLRGARPAIR